MSDSRITTSLRLEIPSLEGKSDREAYEYFKPILGEADELYDEPNYFSFYYNGEFQPRKESSGRSESKRWVVDLVIKTRLAYEGNDLYISTQRLRQLTFKLAQKFGFSESNVILASYLWYDGVDEPIMVDAID